MKKILIGVIGAVILFGLFGAAGYFWGRASGRMSVFQPFGRMDSRSGDFVERGGVMGGRGGMMAYRDAGQEGPLHDEMVAAFAEKLGITGTELEDRLDKGESMLQVAASREITSDQFFTMMTEVRGKVIDQAVKDGTLTQAQADWMKQRSAGMGRGEFGRGACPYLDNDEDS